MLETTTPLVAEALRIWMDLRRWDIWHLAEVAGITSHQARRWVRGYQPRVQRWRAQLVWDALLMAPIIANTTHSADRPPDRPFPELAGEPGKSVTVAIPFRADWYRELERAAADAGDRKLLDTEVVSVANWIRVRAREDADRGGYPPEGMAYLEELLGLCAHWLRGTATVGELSHAIWAFPRSVAYRTTLDLEPDPALREATYGVLTRMAASIVSINAQKEGA